MKILTFTAVKGGVGKTTLAYNYANHLAKSNKVLLIDLDHQCNLTQSFDIYNAENTIAGVFTKQDVAIQNVKPNLDLIPGYIRLDDIEVTLETKPGKDMMLYLWFQDNYDALLSQYDYIIIDTHPSFSTLTRNALVVSHAALSPITPSEFGYTAIFNLEHRLNEMKKELIDYRTRESLVSVKLGTVVNMYRQSTNSSKDLLSNVDHETIDLVNVIPFTEKFNKTTLNKTPLIDIEPKLSKECFDKLTQWLETKG